MDKIGQCVKVGTVDVEAAARDRMAVIAIKMEIKSAEEKAAKKAAKKAAARRRVVILVVGGCCQVDEKPDDVDVFIRDYDVDGVEECDLKIDIDGNEYREVFEGNRI